MSGRFCTEVTPQCPVEATTYGYYPNLGGNIFLCIVFSICALLQLGLGIKYKLRAFGSVATISCAMEAAGYGGRLLMHQNPWSSSGFKLQIVLLILAPSFLAAGIYLTLKHLAMVLGRENSRLPPRLYTWIFIGFDAVSILTQAAGGGLAASTGDLVNIGDKVIITGIAIQVATMAFFYAFSLDFALRVRRNHKAGVQSSEKVTSPGFRGLHDKGFRFYLVASAVAFTAIFIRCVYRIPEMSGGWGSPLMRNEAEFMVLDGSMIAIAAILMTVAHPGIFFPAISSRYTQRVAKQQNDSEADESMKQQPTS